MANYDTWKATEPEAFDEPEVEEVLCKPCNGTGLEKAGTTDQGEPVLDNCRECGGEGCQ